QAVAERIEADHMRVQLPEAHRQGIQVLARFFPQLLDSDALLLHLPAEFLHLGQRLMRELLGGEPVAGPGAATDEQGQQQHDREHSLRAGKVDASRLARLPEDYDVHVLFSVLPCPDCRMKYLDQYLDKPGSLGHLHLATRKLNQLAGAVRKTLPAGSADHVVGCAVAPRGVIVFADSAAWASQFRYLQQDILRACRQLLGEGCTQVQFRVLPPLPTPGNPSSSSLNDDTRRLL